MDFYQIVQTDLTVRLGANQKNITDIIKHKRFVVDKRILTYHAVFVKDITSTRPHVTMSSYQLVVCK